MKEQKPYEEGSILMNAPEHETMEELAEIAQDINRDGREKRMQPSNAWQHWRASLVQHENPATVSNCESIYWGRRLVCARARRVKQLHVAHLAVRVRGSLSGIVIP